MARLDALAVVAATLRHRRVPRAELEAYRDRCLRRVVRHAWERVPYYRRLFDAHGVDPRAVRGMADLAAVPVSRREDLQAQDPADLVARGVDLRRLVEHRTSGSSGRPFTIRRRRSEDRALDLFQRRAMHACGVRRTDRLARVRRVGDEPAGGAALAQRGLAALGLYRQARISCLEPPEAILEALRRFRPDVIGGYAGTLAEVARSLGPQGDPRIRPRIVLPGAEVLTPAMRASLEEAFRAPVRNHYGAWEFNLVAWECGTSGLLHTCDDAVAVEVLDEGRPAARGMLVGTALHSFAMPFIRYELGDVVTRGETPCPCGEPFGTLREVQGRMLDMVALPGGRRVHAYEIWSTFVPHCPWIRRFQLVQEREEHVVLRVVPATPPTPGEVASLRSLAAAPLAPHARLDVELVDEIVPEPGGKFRVCRSALTSAYEPRGSAPRTGA